jgi:cytochrome c553
MSPRTILLSAASAALFAGAVAAPALAQWPPPPAPLLDHRLGAQIAQTCLACHHSSGEMVGAIPGIIGYPASAFQTEMHRFKSGERKDVVMNAVAASLSEEEIVAVAHFFETFRQYP